MRPVASLLSSKRFRGGGEQRRTEERDFGVLPSPYFLRGKNTENPVLGLLILLPNPKETLAHTQASYKHLLGLSGPLGLARVITLVLTKRHSIENFSNAPYKQTAVTGILTVLTALHVS